MPDAVILTALPVEYLAVRKHLIELEEKEHPQGTIYEQGKFVAQGQTWEVGIAEVGAGNSGAAVEAERAIAYFQPNILFFVGIAGGIKDVAIGDVVVATEVYNYESGKVGQQFFTRPKAGKSAYRVLQRAKFEAKQEEWLQRLETASARQPSVFVAPIVAGEKVIASRQSDLFESLRKSYNDAIALEMEGFGFLDAAFAYPKIQAVVIRGISDLIEGKNDDSVEPEDIRQAKAAQHASAFAFEMLTKLEKTSSLQSTVSKVTQRFYSQKMRRLALVGLFIVAFLMVLSGEGWYHQHKLLENPVVVLVANFEDPKDDKWGVTTNIISQLEDALTEYEDVEVKALNEEITAQEGIKVARAKGEKHHADIVLWGWYHKTDSDVQVTVKFEILENLRLLSELKTKPLIQEIAKLDNFEIQTQLSEETSYLTLFTIGLVRYEAKDYENAILRFTRALEFVTDAEQAIVQDVTLDTLYFYRGAAYYTKGELDLAITNYNQAIKINPEYALAYYNRGYTYSKLGNKQKVIQDFKKAAKLYAKQGNTAK
ncbi:MAG: tetratricopeptide repeat protein [Symploca sp. SIO3E6]|nr:tetratricopeptide repeat protein [Caldora sp. SIO3E6]